MRRVVGATCKHSGKTFIVRSKPSIYPCDKAPWFGQYYVSLCQQNSQMMHYNYVTYRGIVASCLSKVIQQHTGGLQSICYCSLLPTGCKAARKNISGAFGRGISIVCNNHFLLIYVLILFKIPTVLKSVPGQWKSLYTRKVFIFLTGCIKDFWYIHRKLLRPRWDILVGRISSNSIVRFFRHNSHKIRFKFKQRTQFKKPTLF